MCERIKKICYAVPIIVFIGFIFTVMVLTYKGQVQNAVEGTKVTFASYTQLSNKFEEILQKNIFRKYSFINLNGYIARLLKINSLNGIQKLRNGYLTNFGNAANISSKVQNLIELKGFLDARNIELVYVLVPSKIAFYDVKFAPGYNSNAWENIENMRKDLKLANLNMLDMDAWFKNHDWDMEKTFFKTDNHWLPQAGLAAARCTMELLARKGLAIYKKEWLEDENYDITFLKNSYLGAWGRRTGKRYGGLDNFSIYNPKFKTNYAFTALQHNSTEWIYRNNILDLSRVDEKDYFKRDLYNTYMCSSNYSLRTTVNAEGVNNKKVLFTGDSFRIPFEYFLTTQFKETYDIDLRRYTDGTFAQYVEEIKPDIVIMCTSERGLAGKELYEFGVKEYLEAFAEPLEPVLKLSDMKIYTEYDNKNNFLVVCDNLQGNRTYTLTLNNTMLLGSENSYIRMALQNLSRNKAIYNRYFYANSDKKQKWIFKTPDNVNENYAIYLYAGTKGHTANILTEVKGIRLQEGISEN